MSPLMSSRRRIACPGGSRARSAAAVIQRRRRFRKEPRAPPRRFLAATNSLARPNCCRYRPKSPAAILDGARLDARSVRHDTERHFDLAGVIDDFLSGRTYRHIHRRRQPIFRGSWSGFRYRLQETARFVSLERASDPRVLLYRAGGRPRILADPAA